MKTFKTQGRIHKKLTRDRRRVVYKPRAEIEADPALEGPLHDNKVFNEAISGPQKTTANMMNCPMPDNVKGSSPSESQPVLPTLEIYGLLSDVSVSNAMEPMPSFSFMEYSERIVSSGKKRFADKLTIWQRIVATMTLPMPDLMHEAQDKSQFEFP